MTATPPAARPDASAPRAGGDLALAVASGGLLTLMVLFNGRMAAAGTPLFSSWAAHGTGALAAVLFLALLRRRGGSARAARPNGAKPAAPLWAYLGGLSGAVTVMLSSVTVNSPLALTGTLALGLLGQVGFGLVADRLGWFGLARRSPGIREWGALALILGGALLVVLGGGP